MTNIFHNLKLLKKDMIENGWIIDSFNFKYKNEEYVVLVHIPKNHKQKPKYASVLIEFINISNFSNTLKVYANSVKLFTDAQTLREYFNIEYSENLGDVLSQFENTLAKFISTQVFINKSDDEKRFIINSLSASDSEDPNKIYCFAVRRNPIKKNGKPAKRTTFNDNKTRYLMPKLYDLLGEDKTLSFMYSTDPDDLATLEEIIKRWNRINK